jgi:hypothetical protein
MNCPKCGYQQADGPECLRCGLVFSRFRSAPHPERPEQREQSLLRAAGGYFLRFYRVFRWITLVVLILAIVLILRTSKPPAIVIPPDAVQMAEDKIQRFESAARRGTENRLELDQPELNGWLNTNLALKKDGGSGPVTPQTQGSLIELAKTAAGGRALDDVSLQQAQSSIRDIKVELRDDLLRLYAIFDLHGMDMSMELEGRLMAQDGYLRMEPTSGKLGSLPLMAGTLQAVADRLFTSPENKEKFKLPPFIQDVQIENGYLVVISR